MTRLYQFFIGLSLLISSQALVAEAAHPFTLITIPKSGSHLTIKALHFLTGGSPIWHTHFPSRYCVPPEKGFLYTHFCVTPHLEENYAQLPELKKIVNIRDLRDVCVSIVRQICKSPWPGMSSHERNNFKQMSFHDQLMFVINFDYEVEDVALFAPNSLQISIAKVAHQAVEYSQNEECLVCKYENLVGPQGGGSEEAQKEELSRIALYLGVDLPEQALESIGSYIYGNEIDPFGQGSLVNFQSTFYQGKTSGWKNYFTEEHKEAFKKRLGKSLIALGYEKDDNW